MPADVLSELLVVLAPDVVEVEDDFVEVDEEPLVLVVEVPTVVLAAEGEDPVPLVLAALDTEEEDPEAVEDETPLETCVLYQHLDDYSGSGTRLTSTAAVSEELTLLVQNPAPVFIEELKAPTWPSVQQNPFPWLFLYRAQEGSAQDCTDAPSTAPMQLEDVGQQAAATAWLAGKHEKEDGQKASPPQDVSPSVDPLLSCKDHPPFEASRAWTARSARTLAEAPVAAATAKRKKLLVYIWMI